MDVKYLLLLLLGALLISNSLFIGDFFYIDKSTGDLLRGMGVGIVAATLFFVILKNKNRKMS